MSQIRSAVVDETGPASVEYALLVTAVAAVIVLVIMALGMITKSMFQDSCNKVKTTEQGTSSTC